MAMVLNISELMDGLGDETLELWGPGVVRPERILALTMGRDRKKTRRPRKIGRILLIAAALTALMSVTAYAVYELVIDRYVIDPPAYNTTREEAGAARESRISLVGYQGTPEYRAYTEWETWLEAHRFDWQAAGVDDSWHETPDNYYVFYGAHTQEQADGLDAIMEKYGLTPHTRMGTYRSGPDLYDALGTDPFYGGVISAGRLTGYVYEDGSFKTEADAVFADGRQVGVQGFTSVKGSFANIGQYLDLEDCEEWSYETASGLVVDLVLASDSAELMAETAGAYINLGLMGGSASNVFDPSDSMLLSDEERDASYRMWREEDPDLTDEELAARWQKRYDATYARLAAETAGKPVVTKADLEALADSVDFAILAARFDGTPHPETEEKVAALEEKERARYDTPASAAEDASAGDQTM